jgi:hypothetical protein
MLVSPCIRPIFRFSGRNYFLVPFFATVDLVVGATVDIGLVGVVVVAAAGFAEAGAAVLVVVVVVGSGSLTGVTGEVGLVSGFAVTVAMYASIPSFLPKRPS